MDKFEKVKLELKSQFFGIDKQIDEIVNGFKFWESIKDYQTKPITISLWGLTGVGKTAPLNKAIELLDLENIVTRVKFNSSTSSLSTEINNNDQKQSIFVLDEFQHLRTIDGNGDEYKRNEQSELNIIWDLIDTGKVQFYNTYDSNKYYIRITLKELKEAKELGIVYEKGILSGSKLSHLVVKNQHSFLSVSDLNEYISEYEEILSNGFSLKQQDLKDKCEEAVPVKMDDSNKSLNSIPEKKVDISYDKIPLYRIIRYGWDDIRTSCNQSSFNYNFDTATELERFILSLKNIDELINFFEELVNSKVKPNVKDFSQSLIWVLGNLDEAYRISSNLNGDLDADYYYKVTSKIKITDIKKSLLVRFRAEEIARLGSKHIIYPSLSKEAFQNIIDFELNKFKNVVKDKFKNNSSKVKDVSFSDKIKDLIYKEGVFPIQGTRCLYSVIDDIVCNKYPDIITVMIDPETKVKSLNIEFDYNKSKKLVIVKFINKDNSLIKEETFPYELKIDDLRREKNKGKQTHRAVHEAGHAVCAIMGENILPEVIHSVELKSTGGFNLYNEEDFYYQRKSNYMNRCVTSIAGYMAEKIVFGEENISEGSASDIDKMTTLLSSLFKDCGFGNNVGKFISNRISSSMLCNENYMIVDDTHEIDNVVQEKINEAMKLAGEMLDKNKLLFLKLSEYLSKHSKMNSKTILSFIKKYAKDFDYNKLTANKEAFYCDKLSEALNSLKS